MSDELKLALQALGAISEKYVRIGTTKEVLRLYHKVQRIVYLCDDIACHVDTRVSCLSLSMYFYPDEVSDYAASFHHCYIQTRPLTSYQLKKGFFSLLDSFITQIKHYYYEQQAADPTRAYILP